MAAPRPALALVHAHPDDEVFFGAGATARYASRGHRVVLITCTQGQLGIDPAGRTGIEDGHDDDATRRVRAGELVAAASRLGVSRLVTLGWADSGMAGWPTHDAPNAFVRTDVDAVARTLAALFDEEGVEVVLTYDEHGFYGHPDHVHANAVTRRAVELASSPRRLYYPVMTERQIETIRRVGAERGLNLPAWLLEAADPAADGDVTTTLDVAAWTAQTHDAMRAHRSQVDNGALFDLPDDLFGQLFGTEYFVRAWSRGPAAGDQNDLCGGLT